MSSVVKGTIGKENKEGKRLQSQLSLQKMHDKNQTESQPEIGTDPSMYNISPPKVGARKNRQKRVIQPDDHQVRSLELKGSNERFHEMNNAKSMGNHALIAKISQDYA